MVEVADSQILDNSSCLAVARKRVSGKPPNAEVELELANEKSVFVVDARGAVEIANDDPGRGFMAHGVIHPAIDDPGIEIVEIGGGTSWRVTP